MGMFGDDILLDHMVVNVRFDMDAAQALFAAAGFTVTPRGYHTLGSINHLMVFASDYLELIGLPPEQAGNAAVGRPEVATAAVGFNGLVFKSSDVDASYQRLRELDMDGDPPRAFSRPVEVDGRSAEAAFRTVAVRPGVFGGGRVYFCEHRTPELIWHDAWQRHANASHATAEFVVVSADAEAAAGRYARLLQREVRKDDDASCSLDLGGSRLVVQAPRAYARRFGELALDDDASGACFGAIVLRSSSLQRTREALASVPAGCRVSDGGDAVRLRLDPFRTLLEFREG
jgi:hypothetical protein